MERCIWKRGFAVLAVILLYAVGLWAEDPLLIVTAPWPPYAIDSDRNISGIDVEITQAVFQELGMSVNIRMYPWKRCLLMIENQNADAILDVSITPERQEYMYFPKEPISEGTTVFFIKADSTIPFTNLEDLNTLRVGTVLGYSYCDDIDQLPFMVRSERVSSLEQNFKKLMAGRLDVVVEVDAVGYYVANQMGISAHIDIIPQALYCQGGNYLAFSHKQDYDQLAIQFSQALEKFKTTDEYKNILKAYGRDVE